jgi:tetracycline 7-halogenase / FADH2 O2-dependent halogenase
MHPVSGTTFDLIVLGSGFGGSMLATILARRGMRVAILDTAQHPRFAIGESSTPSADLILHDLAARYALPEWTPLCRFGTWRAVYPDLLCGCKRGFGYFWHGRGDQFSPSVNHAHELLVAASASRDVADTQWYRPDVDRFLLHVAQHYGVHAWEGIRELRLRHRGPFDWSIDCQHDNQPLSLRTEFVVDATGSRGLVLDALGIGTSNAALRTHSRALYGHWNNLPQLEDRLRDEGIDTAAYPFPCDDAAVHHLFHDGWLWSLRFENGLTSAGFLYAKDESRAVVDSDPETEWRRLTARAPVLEQMFSSARPAEWPGQLFRTDRLQRLAQQGAGPDWAALPSTIGFIDPLHSTGIAQTLGAIERLADILPRDRDRPARLRDYEARIRRELEWIDLLVAGCYASLGEFELFVAWTMIYFAAATTFESRRIADGSPSSRGDFLCADDLEFRATVEELWSRLGELTPASHAVTEDEIETFRRRVKEALIPYNQVGLFAADNPHLYFHTAADKP